ESSSSSSDEAQPLTEAEEETQVGRAPAEEDDTPLSPLAMMNENSPEAWLGQFLLELEMSTPRGTIEGAKRDANLISRLTELRASVSQNQPMALLDPDSADDLRARDWAAWWKAQDTFSRY